MDQWGWAVDGEGDPVPRLLARHPTLLPPYRAYEAELWAPAVMDPVTLEICRLRVAHLLGDQRAWSWRSGPALDAGLDEARVAAVEQWTTAPSYDDGTRACLAFAEQFVLDPSGVTAADRRAVVDRLGWRRLVGLTQAVAVFDGFGRARLVLGLGGGAAGTARHDPEPPAAADPGDEPAGDEPAAAFTAAQPGLFAAFEHLYGTFWSAGVVDHPSKEVARLRNARTTGCRFCRSVRFAQARADGLDEQQVALIADGYEHAALAGHHKAVIALTDRFLADPAAGVDEPLRAQLLDAFGAVGVVELVTGLALMSGFSKIAVALGAFPDDFPITVIPTPEP